MQMVWPSSSSDMTTGFTLFVPGKAYRQAVEVIIVIYLLLPSALIEVLPEVTLLIKQPYANEGHAPNRLWI